ncbi:MAG: phosphoglycerate kinase [Patescibacteria group bacterium]|nr:phosphoglycerate kinase [Patescibacteria group bacterium]
MKSIRGSDISGKNVLVRADLDVPIKKTGSGSIPKVTDDFRLRMIAPTIEYLIRQNAKIIICGHLDRPQGKVVKELKLDPVAKILANWFPVVDKANELFGSKVNKKVEGLNSGDVLILENLRFDPREQENNREFAQDLAELGSVYVNECFAASHRQHASITNVPKILPSFAGFQLEKEVKILSKVRENPKRPLIFLMGGAKVETKVPLVYEFSKIADKILLGGKLMLENDLRGVENVVFPSDSKKDFDIGPKTIKVYKEILANAKTIVWNGPLGKFEKSPYAHGTKKLAYFLAQTNATTIVGGGDTVAALKDFRLRSGIDFISTGGGAMLTFLAEGTLPGLEVLA